MEPQINTEIREMLEKFGIEDTQVIDGYSLVGHLHGVADKHFLRETERRLHINKYSKYPVCPQCGKATIVGFARPNTPFTNDPNDYEQASAEVYCSNGASNCSFRTKFSDLTTPIIDAS